MPTKSIRLIGFGLMTALCAGIGAFSQTSDAKAHAREILNQARASLGGEAALKSLQSLSAFGDFRSGSGSTQASGDVQLDLLLPDKLMRILKFSPMQDVKVTAIQTMDGSRIWTDSQEKDSGPMVTNAPWAGSGRRMGSGRGGGRRTAGVGSSGRSETSPKGVRMPAPNFLDPTDNLQISSDFSSLILGMLLRLPDSSQVEISSEDKDDSSGVDADHLKIDLGNQSIIRLAIDRKTHRPVMASYKIPKSNVDSEEKASGFPDSDTTEVQIYFSEYRQVAGKGHSDLWLPHQITKTRDGLTVEVLHIKKFELNPHLKPKQFEQKRS